MNIKSIRIRNFRAIEDLTINFDSVTTLIGPNGAGKSTVLRALEWFFNGKPGSLTDKDWSFGSTAQVIEVQVTFGGLTEKDRDALGKYAPNGVDLFTAWKKRMPDGTETLSANAKSFPPFNAIRAEASATTKRQLYSTLRSSRPELNLPTAATGAAVEQEMTAWESSHTSELEDAPEELQTNFFGFNSNGKMSGLFDYVLVTADLRASEEAIDARSSIIGRILERSIDRAAADDEIAKIVEDTRLKQQQIYKDKFSSQLDEITKKLNDVVQSYSPGRSVSVSPLDVEIKAPRTTFRVAVLDGDAETLVERQGHGFQRALLVSALQLLAQSGSASAEGVICLAIEEPELFQHPTQAKTFAKVLRALAEDDDKRIQVVYATHSPYFIESRHFDQVRRLTRLPERSPAVAVHFSSTTDIIKTLDGTIDADKVKRQLDGIVTDKLSEAFFASGALLVEGHTDAGVFYGVGDRKAAGRLEAQGLAIVSDGGKGAIPMLHAILTRLGIPTFVLFDGDNGFEARAKADNKTPREIDSTKAGIAKENRKILRYLNEPENDFPEEQIGDRFAVFADNLEGFLRENWPEWHLAHASIEAAAGIMLGKNQHVYRRVTVEAEGDVPEFLNRVLEKALGS